MHPLIQLGLAARAVPRHWCGSGLPSLTLTFLFYILVPVLYASACVWPPALQQLTVTQCSCMRKAGRGGGWVECGANWNAFFHLCVFFCPSAFSFCMIFPVPVVSEGKKRCRSRRIRRALHPRLGAWWPTHGGCRFSVFRHRHRRLTVYGYLHDCLPLWSSRRCRAGGQRTSDSVGC